jgi:hypothetical protein
LRRERAERRQPAVGLAPGEPEHPRPERAEPDADRVRGRRAGTRVVEQVVAAGEGDRALVRPHQADDLLDGVHGLPGASALGAQAGDPGREGAAAEAELEPAAADRIERRCRPREHGRRAQRQVGDVGDEADPAGLGHQGRDQRERVEEVVLVGVILDRDQPEAARVGRPGELADAGQLIRVGDDRDPRYHVVLISPPSMTKVAPVTLLVRAAASMATSVATLRGMVKAPATPPASRAASGRSSSLAPTGPLEVHGYIARTIRRSRAAACRPCRLWWPPSSRGD